MIRIEAAVEPVPFKRVVGNRHKFNDKRYSEYKEVLGYFALQAMKGQPPLEGAIKLSVDFYKHKPKVMDALTGICYLDDRQVVEATGRKHFGEPKVIITLEAI